MESTKTTIMFVLEITSTYDILNDLRQVVETYVATYGVHNSDELQAGILQTDLLSDKLGNLFIAKEGMIGFRIGNERLKKCFKYFKVMFETNMQEASSDIVTLYDVNLVDFCHALKHAETDSNNDPNACKLCDLGKNQMLFSLIDSALYLQNDGVYCQAIKRLDNLLNPQNCLKAMLYGNEYSEEALFSKALRLALYFAEELSSEADTMDYIQNNASHSDIVQHFLKHPMLSVKSRPLCDLISNYRESSAAPVS